MFNCFLFKKKKKSSLEISSSGSLVWISKAFQLSQGKSFFVLTVSEREISKKCLI